MNIKNQSLFIQKMYLIYYRDKKLKPNTLVATSIIINPKITEIKSIIIVLFDENMVLLQLIVEYIEFKRYERITIQKGMDEKIGDGDFTFHVAFFAFYD